MRVALGTIEVSDEARKAIRKLNGGKGDATRGEVKDYLLSHIDDDVVPAAIASANGGGTTSEEQRQDENEEGAAEEQRLEAAREEQAANHVEGAPHGSAPEPVSAEQLPEPPGAGTTGGVTAPSTGNLGQSGTPGGTV